VISPPRQRLHFWKQRTTFGIHRDNAETAGTDRLNEKRSSFGEETSSENKDGARAGAIIQVPYPNFPQVVPLSPVKLGYLCPPHPRSSELCWELTLRDPLLKVRLCLLWRLNYPRHFRRAPSLKGDRPASHRVIWSSYCRGWSSHIALENGGPRTRCQEAPGTHERCNAPHFWLSPFKWVPNWKSHLLPQMCLSSVPSPDQIINLMNLSRLISHGKHQAFSK